MQLYRKARHHLDAAKLLFQLAAQAAQSREHPLRAKKLYVLGALEVRACVCVCVCVCVWREGSFS